MRQSNFNTNRNIVLGSSRNGDGGFSFEHVAFKVSARHLTEHAHE
jgi:hypothetical protein